MPAKTLILHLEQEVGFGLGDPYSLRQAEEIELDAIRQTLGPFNVKLREVTERAKLTGPDARKQFSGAELDNLVAVLITLATGAAGGGLLFKACKDVAVKWLDNRAKRSVTIKLGKKTLKLHGTASNRQMSQLENLLESLDGDSGSKASSVEQPKPTNNEPPRSKRQRDRRPKKQQKRRPKK